MASIRIAPFAASDEAVLRRFAAGSTSLKDAAIVRLMQLKLAQRHGCGYRLTPLGQRRLRALAKPVLQEPDQGDPIAAVLAKYEERFRADLNVAPPRIETRGRPTLQMAKEARTSPVHFFDSQGTLAAARLRIALLRQRLRAQREEDESRAASSASRIAQSLAVLSASSARLQVCENRSM